MLSGKVANVRRPWSNAGCLWYLTARWYVYPSYTYPRVKVQTPISRTPPRPHMRRVLEAVMEPVLPSDGKFMLQKPAALRCTRPATDELKKRSTELSPRELAIRNYLRKHLLEAVVVIICHEHPTDAQVQHYEIMEMASKGIALARMQEAKVMRSLVSGTTLERLTAFFDNDVETRTSLIYTKRYVPEVDDGRHDVVSGKIRDGNYLPLALQYAKRINWILPLAVVYEDRIMTVEEAEHMSSMLSNPIQIRGQTVALLTSSMSETGRLLNEHAVALTRSLEEREAQLEKSKETPAIKDG